MRFRWAISPSRKVYLDTHTTSYLLATICLALLSSAGAAEQSDSLNSYNIRDVATKNEELARRYIPDFPSLDRSLIGRADNDAQSLSNNAPKQSNIQAGDSQFWTFPKSALQRKGSEPHGLPSTFQECRDPPAALDGKEELRKRQDQPNFFISLNLCDQPSPRRSPSNVAPEPLRLYISTSASNQKPDASRHDYIVPVDGGYGSLNLTATNDVHLGIFAPASNDFTGIYNYEIAVSVDDYYAKFNSTNISNFVDSDKQTALVYTTNVTSCNSKQPSFSTWENLPPPYSIFVSKKDDPSILGLQNSMCALKKHAQVQGSADVDKSMTLAGGGQPKQQFYIKGLNASSSYYAIVGLEGTDGNSSSIGGGKVNGGGTIWGVTNFTTKSSPNCAVVYGLDFCSEIAYAVPSNSTSADDLPRLRATYDSYAAEMYINFNKSLQQIPCNTTASAQYSLAVNCTHCARAYKDWLCAVTIPRCQDFSNAADYLQPRAVSQNFLDHTYGQQLQNDPALSLFNKTFKPMNQSRSERIDQIIHPGPYKELLPCEDLCYNLVRSCPAALGFRCPLEGHGLNYTYGRLQGNTRDVFTCNWPGMDLSNASTLRSTIAYAIYMATVIAIWTVFT